MDCGSWKKANLLHYHSSPIKDHNSEHTYRIAVVFLLARKLQYGDLFWILLVLLYLTFSQSFSNRYIKLGTLHGQSFYCFVYPNKKNCTFHQWHVGKQTGESWQESNTVHGGVVVSFKSSWIHSRHSSYNFCHSWGKSKH